MTKTLNLYEAKNQLSALVEQAAAGEDIVIAKHGRPMVRLIAVREAQPGDRVPVGAFGKVDLPDDFDDPLPPEILRGFGVE